MSPFDTTPTAIPDVRTFVPTRHVDDRGYLYESFRAEWFPGLAFVQDNHSYSAARHTLRGLHFQAPPAAQAKLVRVVAGAIRDVAVDLRRGSPTFLQHVAVDLAAAEGSQVFVPAGFAHGFVTLEDDTVVLYKVTAAYAPDREWGIRWDDPVLGIDWGIDSAPVVSPRDAEHPPFDPDASPFGEQT